MRIAVLLFEKLAAQDAVGPYEAFRCVPGWSVEFVGLRRGEVRAGADWALAADGASNSVIAARQTTRATASDTRPDMQ